ncbi:Alcohol oxidase [Rhizoctonia solani]|uniref:Alcohol oxidase n=1 Tax=Rhizoctonia solani TaxID=456999 RepID=A0A8H7I0G5_9AGAM|nr:Alcohol oxidase [Rhizoctonia solani]
MLSYIDLYYLASSGKIAHMHRSLWNDVKEKVTVLQRDQYRIQELWPRKKMGNVEVILHPGRYTTWHFPKSLADRVVLSGYFGPDPLSPPAIDHDYLPKQIDQSILVESAKFADKTTKAEPSAAVLVARQDPIPDIESDEDISKSVKVDIRTLYHLIGTGAMAPKSLGNVVDENLRTYETGNLRVDASIIPMRLDAHLQRTVYSIAEKAADTITSEWNSNLELYSKHFILWIEVMG